MTRHAPLLLALIATGCAVDLSADLSLTEFDRFPDTAVVDNGDSTIACQMTIDAPGARTVKYAGCSFKTPAGFTIGCLATAESPTPDLWECDLTVPENISDNDFTLNYIFAQDDLDAKLFLTAADLLADSGTGTENVLREDDSRVVLFVVSNAPDTVPPVISNFIVTADDPPTSGSTITCTVEGFDPAPSSGYKDTGCSFAASDSSKPLSCINRGGGTPLSSCDMIIPLGKDGVTYTEINHFARDNAYNTTIGDLSRTITIDDGGGGAGGAAGAGGAGGAGGTAGAGGAGGTDCTSKTPDLTANSNSWTDSTLQTAATQSLTFTTYARSTALGNALVTVSDQPMTTFGDASMLVRFSTGGQFEAYNGSFYDSDATINWVTDTWYEIEMVADVIAETYTVRIGLCDQAKSTLITDAAFRDTPVGGLDYYSIWADTGTTIGQQGATWSDQCTAVTCDDIGATCGTGIDDQCSGTINCNAVTGTCTGGCGDCTNPDVCFGTPLSCCPPRDAAWCTSQTYECGDWDDDCGGTVNCDTGGQTCDERVAGEICVAGECVEPSVALEPENTAGPNWETLYEACTGDAYDPGYRPPLFVRPTTKNTGANCTDTASGCPSATLVERTDNISSPGVYENFYKNGTLRIEADNVTIRNFEIRCTGGFGIVSEKGYQNHDIEYGSVIKPPGNAACTHSIIPLAKNVKISHVWVDQHQDDGFQTNNGGAAGAVGPVLIERSLVTRPGLNGGYGSGSHADVWQWFNANGGTGCWFGSRVVPSYCPNYYKSSNITQSGSGLANWYLYNNWFDQSTNAMIAGEETSIRNNKFGNYRASLALGSYWEGDVVDNGGNVFECDGGALTQNNQPSVQGTCPWGFDNDPTDGWDGLTVDQSNGQPLDGQGNPFVCSGTADSQPIDPTEFCTSDGSGCIVTPTP